MHFLKGMQIPTLIEKLKPLQQLWYLLQLNLHLTMVLQNERDVMEMNLSRVLNHAKQTVIHLSENYTAPEKKKITVLGRKVWPLIYSHQ